MHGRTKISGKETEAKRNNSVSQARKPDFSQPTNSPIDHILFLQRTIGNQAVQRLLKGTGFRGQGIGLGIQAKLTIGQPNDVYEQEADRVAEQVMRMPDNTVVRGQRIGFRKRDESVQTKHTASGCPSCKEEELIQPKLRITPLVQRQVEEVEEILQTKEASGQIPEVTPNLESSINTLRGGGEPLPESVRNYFEPRFGYDFGGVRVHTDSMAAESARAVNALAYTVGRDIVFGKGKYTPNTLSGDRLLAHELAHVVQQSGGSAPMIQRDCSDPDFCKPYATTAEVDSAKWWIRNTYMRLEGLPTFGTEVEGLYESFLSRKPGDSLAPVVFNSDSSYLVSSFKNSGNTTDDMDNVIDLVGSRLDRAPGWPLRDNVPTMMSLSNFLSRAEMENRPINYSNPFSVAGHIAGGIGSSDAGPDYRKITYANVTLEKTTLFGSTGYISVELTPHYEVFDAIDFCPGDCGSPAEQLITVPMSRLEAGGAAYDVPFKVIFTPEPRSKRFWF